MNTQQFQREKSRRGDSSKGKGRTQNNMPNQAHQAAENRSTKHDNDSNPKLFISQLIGISFMVKDELQKVGTNSI